MPLIPPQNGRLFIGPASAELIGFEDGVPVTADEDGAGRMTEITQHVRGLKLTGPENDK